MSEKIEDYVLTEILGKRGAWIHNFKSCAA